MNRDTRRATWTRIRRLALLAGFLGLTAGGLQAGEWKHYAEAEGLPDLKMQFVKSQGADVWAGTLKGLVVFRNGKLETVFQDAPAYEALVVGEDLWIGTESGVVRQRGSASKAYLQGAKVGRIVPFGANAIWALSKPRLMEFANRTWQEVERFNGLAPVELFVTRAGGVWVQLDCNGIVEAHSDQPPDQWTHHLKGLNITAFCEDSKGRILCGTWDRGLMVFDGGRWTRMLNDEKAVLTAVRQDGKGHLWVATNLHGVLEYDGAAWVNHLEDEGYVNMLDTTPDGQVLVSSQSVCSLRRWNGKTWEVLLDTPTMTLGVTTDAKGKLWAANTLDGLYAQP